MMINKRLIGTVPDSKPYIAGNVALQWLSLLSNAGMIFSCAWFLQQLLEGAAAPRTLALPLAAGLAAVLVRGICTVGAGRMSFLAARSVPRAWNNWKPISAHTFHSFFTACLLRRHCSRC